MKKYCGTLGIYGLDMQARQANFHRADLDPLRLLSRELVPPRVSHKSASRKLHGTGADCGQVTIDTWKQTECIENGYSPYIRI